MLRSFLLTPEGELTPSGQAIFDISARLASKTIALTKKKVVEYLCEAEARKAKIRCDEDLRQRMESELRDHHRIVSGIEDHDNIFDGEVVLPSGKTDTV